MEKTNFNWDFISYNDQDEIENPHADCDNISIASIETIEGTIEEIEFELVCFFRTGSDQSRPV